MQATVQRREAQKQDPMASACELEEIEAELRNCQAAVPPAETLSRYLRIVRITVHVMCYMTPRSVIWAIIILGSGAQGQRLGARRAVWVAAAAALQELVVRGRTCVILARTKLLRLEPCMGCMLSSC